jgi:hypothetical protein
MRSPLEEDELYGVVEVDKNDLAENAMMAINTRTSPLYEDNLYGVVYPTTEVKSNSVVNHPPASSGVNDPLYGLVEVDITQAHSPSVTSPLEEDELYGVVEVDNKNDLHGIVYAEDYAASKTLSTHQKNLHL